MKKDNPHSHLQSVILGQCSSVGKEVSGIIQNPAGKQKFWQDRWNSTLKNVFRIGRPAHARPRRNNRRQVGAELAPPG